MKQRWLSIDWQYEGRRCGDVKSKDTRGRRSDGKSFNIKKEHAQLSTAPDVLGSMSEVGRYGNQEHGLRTSTVVLPLTAVHIWSGGLHVKVFKSSSPDIENRMIETNKQMIHTC